MATSHDRYHRQGLIKGWEQERLQGASVAILGSDALAQFSALSLISLGIGGVFLYDATHPRECRGGLLSLASPENSAVEALESVLARCNPRVRVSGIHVPLTTPLLPYLLEEPSVIIDTTNDHALKRRARAYALEHRIPFVNTSAGETRADMTIAVPDREVASLKLFPSYAGRRQDMLASEIMGGVIAEEVRKILLPLSADETALPALSYSRTSATRFHPADEREFRAASLAEKHAFVTGAGALSNFASLGLALSGVGRITILDFDRIESTNLNRQPFLYDAVGEYKSITLAERLQRINGAIRIDGLVGKLDEKCDALFKKHKPDVLFDCVDNLATRAITNYYAVRYGIPLVSGGTSHAAGQVAVYVPGESSCLQCALNVNPALVRERTRQSCIQAPQASVVTTNQIIGGCMAVEGCCVLEPGAYGASLKKTLKYDSHTPARAGLMGSERACSCSYPAFDGWIESILKRYAGDL